MHRPGIEPGSVPWQGTILPLDHRCKGITHVRVSPLPGIEPGSPAWQAGILTTILQRLFHGHRGRMLSPDPNPVVGDVCVLQHNAYKTKVSLNTLCPLRRGVLPRPPHPAAERIDTSTFLENLEVTFPSTQGFSDPKDVGGNKLLPRKMQTRMITIKITNWH